MSTYFYDVCIHGEDYEERSSVEFSNPVIRGDFITSGDGVAEYKVFQVIHSSVGGGSAIHAEIADNENASIDSFIENLPEEI